MPGRGLGSMSLETANGDLRDALPNGTLTRVSPHRWSLEIVNNLECFMNLRLILAHRPWQSSLYRSNFNISVPVANSMTKLYTWIDKSLSLARQPLLMVALNYRSFAPSLRCQAAAQYGCRGSWLDISWARKQRSTQSPSYWQYGKGVSALMVTWDCSWRS